MRVIPICSVIIVDANILSDMVHLEGKEDNLDAKIFALV